MNPEQYRAAIADALDGERLGVEIVALLASRLPADARVRRSLDAMGALEAHMIEVLRPVAERHAIAWTPQQQIVERAKAMIDEVHGWADLIAVLLNALPPFVIAFDALAQAADLADRAALSRLSRHERALLIFAQEAKRDPLGDHTGLLDWTNW